MERTLLCLMLMVPLMCALKQRREPFEWDYRPEAEKVNMRGCANLTTVLDNWKFAIMTQFRNLLLYDHHTVLPDYGRIKSLSEALDDLYKEFNALKERLGELSTKFEGVEVFVDEMNAGRQMAPQKSVPTAAQPAKQPVALKEFILGPGVLTNQRMFKRPKAPVNQERLGELSTKFEGVEVFVDEKKAGRPVAPPKSVPTAAQPSRPVALKEIILGPGVLTNQRMFKRPKAPVNQS